MTCTIENIRFCEPAETTYTVNDQGNPEIEVGTDPIGEPSPHPYFCEFHGLDFTDWDDVKKHLEASK